MKSFKNGCLESTIFRTFKGIENPYSSIDNKCLRDNRLSWKAKGILCYLLSRPNNWTFYVNELSNHSKDGRDSLSSGIKELKELRYLRTIQDRSSSGKFGKYITYVYESPDLQKLHDVVISEDSHISVSKNNINKVENPITDLPVTGFPISVNPTLINTDSNKKLMLIKTDNNINVKFDDFDEDVVCLSTNGDIEMSSNENCEIVFDHWKSTFNHPRAKLDIKRKSIIKRALKDYEIEDLKKSIDGCSKTPHNMGDNDRGEMYYGLHVIFKDCDQIERFMRNDDIPPTPRKIVPKSAAERASIALQATREYFADQPWFSGKNEKEFNDEGIRRQASRIEFDPLKGVVM